MNLIESWVTRDRYRVVFTEFGLGVLRYGRRQPHREKDSGMTSEPGSAFDAGITTRRQVMGDEFVDRALARTSGTESEPIQRFVTEHVWDAVWNRPGLSRRDRSLVTLGILIALRATEELKAHFQIARQNGLTDDELAEVIYHASGYAGFPAAATAKNVAVEALFTK